MPSKLTAVGVFVGILGVLLTVVMWKPWIRGPTEEEMRLRSEVYREISRACHRWKNAYISLYPGQFKEYYKGFGGVWEMLEKAPAPSFSAEAWRRYQPLFEHEANRLRTRLDQISAANGNLLPPGFRTLVIETKRCIEIEQVAYAAIPVTIKQGEDNEVFFGYRFREMVRYIAKLCREADRFRAEDQRSLNGS